MTKQIVTVFGATGMQGGSIVRELLKHPNDYHIRGVTRNPDSDAAKQLASQGVEVVKADLKNFDEVLEAMKGAHVVFGVTNFWDKEIAGGDQTLEVKQGKILADAAAEAKVGYYIWR